MNRWPLYTLCTGTLALVAAAGPAIAQSDAVIAVREYRAANEREIVAELVDFLSLPNVASDVPAMLVNAEALVGMMERRGIEGRVIETGGAPHVYGELLSEGAERTVLFYCHFDGQPVDPDRWIGHDPWHPVFRDAPLEAGGNMIDLPEEGALDPEIRLYARSASDDKSPIVALMAALDALKATGRSPTSNLKFFFEGDEEAGSPTLESIIRSRGDLLAADLVVAVDGPSDPSRLPTLYFGARGIVTLQLTVYGPVRPLHSGHYGNWAPNPAMALSQLLASMKDPVTGRVLVSGFYDDVVPLSEFELAAIARAPNDDREQMKAFGLARTEAEGERLVLINLPSLNVRGMKSGWVGSEARTIVPDVGIASIDLRLVKNVRPREQVARVVAHIEAQGYHVSESEPSIDELRSHPRVVGVQSSAGYAAFRTSMDLPISRALIRSIEENTGMTAISIPTTGGSVPLYVFTDILRVPTVIVPIVNHDNNQHSPNENLRLGNLWSGIETLSAILLMN